MISAQCSGPRWEVVQDSCLPQIVVAGPVNLLNMGGSDKQYRINLDLLKLYLPARFLFGVLLTVPQHGNFDTSSLTPVIMTWVAAMLDWWSVSNFKYVLSDKSINLVYEFTEYIQFCNKNPKNQISTTNVVIRNQI